jgi:predicted protein tyrosine phosphatase
MKPWIVNISHTAVRDGFHFLVPGKTTLIRIVDREEDLRTYPALLEHFNEVHEVIFADVDGSTEPSRISSDQAEALVDILISALNTDTNLVVQCTAGISRSGAVVESGVRMGFRDTLAFRLPNLLVLSELTSHACRKLDE